MNHISISLVVILYSYQILKESRYTEEYLSGSCKGVGQKEIMPLMMTLMVIHLSGFACLSHFGQCYSECIAAISGNFRIYGASKLRIILSLIPGSMLTWKMLLLQRRLVEKNSRKY